MAAVKRILVLHFCVVVSPAYEVGCVCAAWGVPEAGAGAGGVILGLSMILSLRHYDLFPLNILRKN